MSGIWQEIKELALDDLSIYMEEIACESIDELIDPKDRQMLASSLGDLNLHLKPQEETYVDWELGDESLAQSAPIQMNSNGQAGAGIYLQFPIYLAQSKFTIYATNLNGLGQNQWCNALGICAADRLRYGQSSEILTTKLAGSDRVAQWQVEAKDLPKHVQDLPAAPDFIGRVLATFGTAIAKTIFSDGASRVVAESEQIGNAVQTYWQHSLKTLSTIESN